MEKTFSLTPPRFVNMASEVVYGDLPAPLFQSLCRVAGLAWNADDKRTLPELTPEELSVVVRCKQRQTWEHLLALRRAGWLSWTMLGDKLLIRLELPSTSKRREMQNFASAGDDDEKNKNIESTGILSSSPSPRAPMQNFALSEKMRVNLAVLAEFGVNHADPEATEVAQLDHVTPQFIRAWAAELMTLPRVKQLPLLLLHKLCYTQQLPRIAERRGGSRKCGERATQRAPEREEPSALGLPDDLLAGLGEIVWTDGLDEVEKCFAEDPARVRAWLEHARTSKKATNRAGLFRYGLRQANKYPPAHRSAEKRTPPPKSSPVYKDDSEFF